MKRFLVLLAGLLLAGCGVIAQDARQAAILAQKYSDAQAAECFNLIASDLEKQAALAEESGGALLTLLEKARITRRYVEANRESFSKACGPILADGLVELVR